MLWYYCTLENVGNFSPGFGNVGNFDFDTKTSTLSHLASRDCGLWDRAMTAPPETETMWIDGR